MPPTSLALTPASPAAHVSDVGGVTPGLPTSRPRGRHLVVLAAQHGDEPAGVKALNALNLTRLPDSPWSCVTCVLGNPPAFERGVRFVDANLNRCFTDEVLSVGGEASTPPYEHARARELAPLLAAADAVLDLHTTSAPTPPFAMFPPQSQLSAALAAALPVDFALADATGAGLGLAIEYAARRGGAAAVTVECGQHGAAAAADVAAACIRAALSWRVDASMAPPPPPKKPVFLNVDRGELVRPGFRWAGAPPPAFGRVEEGAVIATDDRGDIVCDVPGGALIVLPAHNLVVGEDAWLWGVERK